MGVVSAPTLLIVAPACPHVKKQTLQHSKTQPSSGQVIIDQQWVACALCNDMYDHGRCSLDNKSDNDSTYHTQSFLDRNDQSHKGSVQVVDDDEVENLLSNDDNSHTCLQQILRALDPSHPDPFAPSNFDEDTMEFIPASSPKHVPLYVEERAQLDLLRILGKAGVSLQLQDTIIDWACHYSLVNKLHNGDRDFWIHHNIPGRESKQLVQKGWNLRPQAPHLQGAQ